jgi:hypothetical protein
MQPPGPHFHAHLFQGILADRWIEVFSVASVVFELGEDECGFGDGADSAGAQGDVV